MEGPLSKWTNVMKGWQYRWFVLQENAGLLSYFTSKEKMMRGSRRGCVRLRGAVIGIDDEDDSTFTITVDQKTFHFQARDAEEKDKWIEALEITILRHSHRAKTMPSADAPCNAFEKKLAECDMYLQLLIEQQKNLKERIRICDNDGDQATLLEIYLSVETLVEYVKHGIAELQVARYTLQQPRNVAEERLEVARARQRSAQSSIEDFVSVHENAPVSMENQQTIARSSSYLHSLPSSPKQQQQQTHQLSRSLSNSLPDLSSQVLSELSGKEIGQKGSENRVPITSYSSSDDEDFFDAVDNVQSSISTSLRTEEVTEVKFAAPVITSKDDFFDELYDDNEEDELGSLDQHGSLITHLLSQIRIGMDLTKIILPTFILERRSLLEMYADFFAHPDLFSSISDKDCARDRIVQVVRWYLSAFHAGRRNHVAKKPYNPLLGEVFKCHYDIPGTTATSTAEDGPVCWATKESVSFIAEQVSHHPPISAFYAENYSKKVALDGYVWTKSKFLGLSIGVYLVGQAIISVIDLDEEYIITFPTAYGRSIMTIPWIELGGKVTIVCNKTGYSANIEFQTKPFYGGKKDQIAAEIFAPYEKKPFCTVNGEWNGIMWAVLAANPGMHEIFVDTTAMPVVKKRVLPIEQQEEFESRRLWKDVTIALKERNIEEATDAKYRLEQRQRDEAKERAQKNVAWHTKHFHEVGEHWVYDKPLVKRLNKQAY